MSARKGERLSPLARRMAAAKEKPPGTRVVFMPNGILQAAQNGAVTRDGLFRFAFFQAHNAKRCTAQCHERNPEREGRAVAGLRGIGFGCGFVFRFVFGIGRTAGFRGFLGDDGLFFFQFFGQFFKRKDSFLYLLKIIVNCLVFCKQKAKKKKPRRAFCYFTATSSTSILEPLGRAATCTQERAGQGAGK